MALLKEDGSLDIERINGLQFEDYLDEMGTLTKEQVEEYLSMIPINESTIPMKAIVVESIEKYGVDADDFLNNMRETISVIGHRNQDKAKEF